MRIRSILRVIALMLVACAFALIFAACGGSGKRAVVQGLRAPEASFSPGSSSAGSGGQPQHGVTPPIQAADSLESALVELDAYPTPDGVDAVLFAQLKDALASRLTTKNQHLPAKALATAGLTTARFASTPPTGDENRVTDLAITDNGGGTYTLTWHYRNLGDYDQNGTVGISDITPIAMHYNETYDIEDVNCLLAVIDGSGNGVVDIADITPIAMYYSTDCAGYRVQGQVATGSWTEINSVSFSLAHTEVGRLQFSYDLGALTHDFYRVVPYDASGLEGIRSTVVPESASQPPNILWVSPMSGFSGASIAFTATVDGSGPFSYSWVFGGGSSPNTSAAQSPTATLGSEGNYSASLSVTNSYGTDTLDFTLTITGSPPVITGVTPTSGNAGAAVTFTPTVTGTPPFDYSWNFGGGATPNTSSQSSPTVTLGQPDSYIASLTVTNACGDDTYPFALTVMPKPKEWHIVTVDSAGGGYTSLAVVNGNPAISYFGATNADLNYVRASDAQGSSWGSPITVDSAGDVGLFTSLFVVNGNPAISYYDDTNGYLKYARATDANGTSWNSYTVDSVGNVGWSTSLAVVDGNPAISYYDSTNYDLKYVRASDASGSSWGSPITLDSAGSVGLFTSLTVVNGNPAISYYDESNVDLKYVRASDANGSSWGSPITVDSAGWVGQYTSLFVVNGNPAISYYDGTNSDLKYVRASDAQGSSWGSPITVDSDGRVGRFTSLAIVRGNPAISYCDDTNVDLKYVRASNANGSSWGSPITVDSAENVGLYISLAVVNGNPAISYLDHTDVDVKFAIYY